MLNQNKNIKVNVSASEYRLSDNESDKISKHYIKIIRGDKKFSFLSKWGGHNFFTLFLNRSILKEVRKIHYASILKKINFNKFDRSNLNFHKSLFNDMNKKLLGILDFKLSYAEKIYLNLYELIKFFYFFIKILFFSEIQFFKFDYSKKNINSNYEYAFIFDNLYDRVLKLIPNVNQSILIKEDDDVSFSRINSKFTDPNVIDLNNIITYSLKLKYLKRFYLNDLIFKFKILYLSLYYPFLISSLFSCYRKKVLWQIFFIKFKVKKIVRSMSEGEITSSILFKNNNATSIFNYFSSTEPIIENYDSENTICYEYSYIQFDYIISSNLSNQWLKKCGDHNLNYISLGPIFSDIAYNSKKSSIETKNIYGIPSDKKIISFFDHTVGEKGIENQNSYNLFLESILSIANKYDEYLCIFKSKKNYEDIKKHYNTDGLKNIKKILNSNKVLYANDIKISSLELIGISNLIISSPLSSIIYESFSVSTIAITYDSFKQYNKLNALSVKMPKSYVTNYNELIKLIDYWLEEATDEDVDDYINDYVSHVININKHGNILDLYKKTLINL